MSQREKELKQSASGSLKIARHFGKQAINNNNSKSADIANKAYSNTISAISSLLTKKLIK